jgi:hypothetical protein
MFGASYKNKMASIGFVLGFTVSVVAISISFNYDVTAAVTTTPGWRR